MLMNLNLTVGQFVSSCVFCTSLTIVDHVVIIHFPLERTPSSLMLSLLISVLAGCLTLLEIYWINFSLLEILEI